MKDYLSYSQISCYLYDPMEYYRRYILGLQSEPTEPMKFGSIVHRALAESRYDWGKALRKEGFTPDYNRVLASALGQIDRPPIREKKIVVEHEPIDLLAIFDGLDDGIIEYKTCSSHWNQSRVDEDLQLSFYSLVYYKHFGKMPKIKLISINSRNGSVKQFSTKRYKKDFPELQEKIEFVYQGIKNGKWTL